MTGKRANLFGQGRPENPYDERDEPAETPQRATAAQLAARKIKSAKPRRAAGASSGLSQSVNFSGAQPSSGFNFGASAPIGGGGDSGANAPTGMFGGFGASTTNSFPPAQASNANSNSTFTNNSFPAPTFGAMNQSSGFQPPTGGFDFSPASSTNNPFGGLNGGAPATNGASTGFGGSMFGSQPASNPFGGAQQDTSSSTPSTSMFGTTNGASTPTFTFGGASSSAAAPSLPAPASQPTFTFGANASTPAAPSTPSFKFGASASAAPASTSAPAFQFGATSSAAPASTLAPTSSSSLFNFGGTTQNNASPAATPAFGGFGAASDAQQSQSTPAPAAAPTGLFNFGAATPVPAEPATSASNMFGNVTTSAPASAGNPFASLQATTTSSTPQFNFGQPQEAPTSQAATPASAPMFGFGQTSEPQQTQESAPASAPLFNFGQPSEPPKAQESTPDSTPKFGFGQSQETPKAQEATPATTSLFNSAPETPKPNNLFAGLPKPASTPAPNFSSMFGASQSKENAPKETEKPAVASMFQAPEAPKTNMFSGFSTPQPAKTADNEQAKAGGMFTAQPKPSNGFTFQAFGSNNAQEASTPSKPQAAATQETSSQPPSASSNSNPFASLPSSSNGSSGLFNKAQPPAPPTPAQSTVSDVAATPQLPKIGKLSVPKDWVVENIPTPQHPEELVDHIVQLGIELEAMNLKFREIITNASLIADWSALSIWHHQQSRTLKTKIDNAKKQRAAAHGVTGNESTLSTKRSATEESSSQESSKRSRPSEPSTPTPKSTFSSTTTPKANPPATASSSLFSKAISQGTTPEKSAEPPKTASAAPVQSTGFTPLFSASVGPSAPKSNVSGFTPSLSASTGSSSLNGVDSSKSAPKASAASTGFTPSFGAPKAASAGGFKPSFGGSSGGSTDFMAAFAKTAKTYEQLAAERKKKAKDADYDSDDETEEEWSARYDKEEAERLAKEKEAVKSASGFSIPGSANASGATTPTSVAEPAKQPANDKPTTSANPFASLSKPVTEDKSAASTNPFASLSKPASGTSSPNLFSASSPAPSASGGRSVFDTPSAAPSPSGNLFSHLSSGESSTNQDDTDDEDDRAASTSPKRKLAESETDSDDTANKKQVSGTKGSLLSRMTRADDAESEAEKESDKPTSTFGQTNGASTPTNKPFAFFNFDNAGANTAPPKNTFAGDQTFKVGSPIKFGAPATEKKKDGPIFQFQPATPSPAEFSTTPAKPPPANSLFNFGGAGGSSLLAPNFGASAPSSVPSSVFNSRAGTPASENEASKDTGAQDDDEEEKHEQVDLSQLTAEEKASNDVVFHIDLALAKQQVDQGDGTKKWENFARGPLWILKDKESGKCFVRIRIPSGATPLNYQILPALRSTVAGGSRKMVQATRPGKDKGLTPVYFAVKSSEIAEEFSRKYNEAIPPS
ncbi:hypothetical protein G6514_008075 [Epicoccum nigrum]|nr:hypothetical protein G6514_008075 [Epicoccum nigrum]